MYKSNTQKDSTDISNKNDTLQNTQKTNDDINHDDLLREVSDQ